MNELDNLLFTQSQPLVKIDISSNPIESILREFKTELTRQAKEINLINQKLLKMHDSIPKDENPTKEENSKFSSLEIKIKMLENNMNEKFTSISTKGSDLENNLFDHEEKFKNEIQKVIQLIPLEPDKQVITSIDTINDKLKKFESTQFAVECLAFQFKNLFKGFEPTKVQEQIEDVHNTVLFISEKSNQVSQELEERIQNVENHLQDVPDIEEQTKQHESNLEFQNKLIEDINLVNEKLNKIESQLNNQHSEQKNLDLEYKNSDELFLNEDNERYQDRENLNLKGKVGIRIAGKPSLNSNLEGKRMFLNENEMIRFKKTSSRMGRSTSNGFMKSNLAGSSNEALQSDDPALSNELLKSDSPARSNENTTYNKFPTSSRRMNTSTHNSNVIVKGKSSQSFNDLPPKNYLNKNGNDNILRGLKDLKRDVELQREKVISLSVQVREIKFKNPDKKLEEIVALTNETFEQVVNSVNEQLSNVSDHLSILFSKFDDYVLKGDLIELFRHDQEGTAIGCKCLACGKKENTSCHSLRSTYWVEDILDQPKSSTPGARVKLLIGENDRPIQNPRLPNMKFRRDTK